MEAAEHDGERPLAARVCAALERLANAQRRLMQDLATRHGLSPLQVQILGLLDAGPPPAPRGGSLSRELGVAPPTVSDAVASLRAKGLVDRVPDPADRRAGRLVLTGAGHTTALSLHEGGDQLGAAVAQLPPRQQEQALQALLRVISSCVDAGIVGVARTCPTCRFFQQRPEADHCALLDIALPVSALRVNCAEHQPATSQP